MSADYFPLKENTRYEYKFKSTEFEGVAKIFIDILKVCKKPGKTAAQARMIFELRDSHTTEYSITRDAKWFTTADGVITGGRREFPMPPKEGFKWNEYLDSNEIVSLSDKVSIKAGKFRECMKVVTMFSGGDAGKSVRYYAPGVGYILEEYTGGDKTCEVELTAITKVPEENKKIKEPQHAPPNGKNSPRRRIRT
ncbi:MAG TPA: hypothetical protein DCL44_03595 [Elusimicrobia bacterium]|nr:hypothetical protein [Elusimicrobiota bacterium]